MLNWRTFIKEIIHWVSYEEADLTSGASGMHQGAPRPRLLLQKSGQMTRKMQ